ncbi:MAG: hypothetical protein O2921_10940 [Chloroflexi bacterium]|nr:hypothetical protein [Chloroflexota bacterium]MDA1283111.1 hypothetical protein [Chloroflexota bacterium]
MEYNPIHLDIVWVLFATVLVFLMQAVVRSLLELVRTEIVSNPHLIFVQCSCTKARRAYMLSLSISTLVDT